MAGRNHRLLKQTCRFFASAGGEADGTAAAALAASPKSAALPAGGDEFDESEVWGSTIAEDDGEVASGPRTAPRKQPSRGGADRHRGAVAASLPVNIPDWSKILREEVATAQRQGGGESWDSWDGQDGARESVVPPHEYLWKKRGGAASFSVHEGVGRTLKGRDLSRVRNAVWQQTGFQD